jgi:predicted XRE-type DNA-binding protein
MSQNSFVDTGFSDEDATVFALEADCASAIAGFIQRRFPGNQTAAAKHLKLHQSEVSALLSGNLGRFSLAKLIRIARRSGLRLFLDMGDDAQTAEASSLRPTIAPSAVNLSTLDMQVAIIGEGPLKVTPSSAKTTNSAKYVRQ